MNPLPSGLTKEVEGKYYVYVIEKESKGNARHHYVAPLTDIVEFTSKPGVWGPSPSRVRDLNLGNPSEPVDKW